MVKSEQNSEHQFDARELKLLLVLPEGNIALGGLLFPLKHSAASKQILQALEREKNHLPQAPASSGCVDPPCLGSDQVDLASENGSFVRLLLSDTTAE